MTGPSSDLEADSGRRRGVRASRGMIGACIAALTVRRMSMGTRGATGVRDGLATWQVVRYLPATQAFPPRQRHRLLAGCSLRRGKAAAPTRAQPKALSWAQKDEMARPDLTAQDLGMVLFGDVRSHRQLLVLRMGASPHLAARCGPSDASSYDTAPGSLSCRGGDAYSLMRQPRSHRINRHTLTATQPA